MRDRLLRAVASLADRHTPQHHVELAPTSLGDLEWCLLERLLGFGKGWMQLVDDFLEDAGGKEGLVVVAQHVQLHGPAAHGKTFHFGGDIGPEDGELVECANWWESEWWAWYVQDVLLRYDLELLFNLLVDHCVSGRLFYRSVVCSCIYYGNGLKGKSLIMNLFIRV